MKQPAFLLLAALLLPAAPARDGAGAAGGDPLFEDNFRAATLDRQWRGARAHARTGEGRLEVDGRPVGGTGAYLLVDESHHWVDYTFEAGLETIERGPWSTHQPHLVFRKQPRSVRTYAHYALSLHQGRLTLSKRFGNSRQLARGPTAVDPEEPNMVRVMVRNDGPRVFIRAWLNGNLELEYTDEGDGNEPPFFVGPAGFFFSNCRAAFTAFRAWSPEGGSEP